MAIFMSLVLVLNMTIVLDLDVGAEAIKHTYKSKTYIVTYEVSSKKATVLQLDTVCMYVHMKMG